jgi:hypothetical protein
VEGLTLAPETDPLEKIKVLEEQICTRSLALNHKSTEILLKAQLRNKLYDQQMRFSPNQSHHPSSYSDLSTSAVYQHAPSTITHPTFTGISLPHVSLDMNPTSSGGPDSRIRNENGSQEAQSINSKNSDPFMDLFFSGWNPDLPDPPLLNHL